eukprot:6194887-Heterocapsa_arctica.AAC.1
MEKVMITSVGEVIITLDEQIYMADPVDEYVGKQLKEMISEKMEQKNQMDGMNLQMVDPVDEYAGQQLK